MEVTLRPATAADAPRVANLLIDTRAAFMPYAPSAHTDGEIREWVASHLVPMGGVTVAEDHGRVIGTMAIEVAQGASWVTQMAIEPALVGQGVGTVLLALAMRALTPPIRLYTFQANSGARRFYERHGFVAIAFTDGLANEEHCADVLYEFKAPTKASGDAR